MFNNNEVKFENCIFLLNTVTLYGGGIYIEKSKVSINQSLFLQNKAEMGGGIYYVSTSFIHIFLLI